MPDSWKAKMYCATFKFKSRTCVFIQMVMMAFSAHVENICDFWLPRKKGRTVRGGQSFDVMT